MAVCQYLAMTAAEISAAEQLPQHLAYMACHFSAYGTGLSNMPRQLPADSLLILNDRVPICGHDHNLITQQLLELVEQLQCAEVLLDFQRPDYGELSDLTCNICAALPCPVVVSSLYAQALSCPVFLPPVPLHKPLASHIAPWKDRQIWLEAALEYTCVTVTEEGSIFTPTSYTPPLPQALIDPALHCAYEIKVEPDRVLFHLYRTQEQLKVLLDEAESMGITKAVGLYQQFRHA